MDRIRATFSVIGNFLIFESELGMDSYNLDNLKYLSKSFKENNTCVLLLKFPEATLIFTLAGVDEQEQDVRFFKNCVNLFVNNIFEKEHESCDFYLLAVDEKRSN